uniref:Uncharacterized protein n=1 Tax=Rhizophora mucronata TaxID=61149 RepID=A0A2P2J3X0_RHIMU
MTQLVFSPLGALPL